VKQGNLSYTVVDYVGNSFAANTLSNGSIEFTLDDDWSAVSLTGTTDEEKVELSYQAEALSTADVASTTTTTTTQAPEPTESDDVGSLVEVSGGAKGVVFMCALAAFYL
jgi:hypothetical protein